MRPLADESIDLVVTSPPYPMIEMWDESFTTNDPRIAGLLEVADGAGAFARMHEQLDAVWRECLRVLRPGAFVCINIGDATRTLGGSFRLYSNHARVVTGLESLGMRSLPLVLWRKQTNAPNKFMGSGMLPAGAYVTLEHEYILIFRKGDKRLFDGDGAARRRASAIFWEERNQWFSDVWDFKGARQPLPANEARSRSAAFPLELAHRLVNMYSLQGDCVLDPFLGTGTTAAACALNGRNSVGFEQSSELAPIIRETLAAMNRTANRLVAERLAAHRRFLREYEERRGEPPRHTNTACGFPVVTGQERELQLLGLTDLREDKIEDDEDEDAPRCDTLRFTAAHTPVDAEFEARALFDAEDGQRSLFDLDR